MHLDGFILKRLKGNVALSTPCKRIEGAETQLHSFLTSAEHGGKWLTTIPDRLGQGNPSTNLIGACNRIFLIYNFEF